MITNSKLPKENNSIQNISLSTYRYLYYVTLLFALSASCIYLIGWSSADLLDLFFHIKNRLWLITYILLFILGLISINLQIYRSIVINKSISSLKKHGVEFIVLFIVLVMCICSYLGNQNRELFVLSALALLSWPITKKAIVMEVFVSQILLLIVGMILVGLKVNQDIIIYPVSRVRHFLGFGHPNTVGIIVFSIITLMWVLYSLGKSIKRNKTIFLVLTSLSLLFLFYYLSESRTSLIAGLSFILLSGYYFLKSSNRKSLFSSSLFRLFFSLLPVLSSLVSIFLGILFEKIEYRNNFSVRFYEGIQAIFECKIHIFGTDAFSLTLDNNYFAILIRAGILFFICYLLISSLSCNIIVNQKNLFLIIFYLVFHVYLTMECYTSLLPLLFIVFSFTFCDCALSTYSNCLYKTNYKQQLKTHLD